MAKFRFIAALLISTCCLFSSAQSTIEATPSFSRSPTQKFPRVSGLANEKLEARTNALLSKREQSDRLARRDCLHAGSPAGQPPTYNETIRLTYLSQRLLSIDVRATWLGCASYPNINISLPLTLDLTQGQDMDWHHFFTDDFLGLKDKSSSKLMNLYLRHAQLGPECIGSMNESRPNFDFWLDARHGRLMAKPVLPHVVQACSKVVGLPFSEVQSFIRNPLDRRDLLAAKSFPESTPAHKPLP